jgi:hypothetical protein
MNTELISNTFQLLRKTFTEKDNDQRKLAEAELFQLRKYKLNLDDQIVDHLSSIFFILQNEELDHKLKLSIVLYVKGLLKSKIDSKLLTQEQLVTILKLYIELYLSEKVQDNVLQNLNLSLTDVLNSGQVTNVIPELILYLKSNVTNITKFKGIIYIMQLIISTSVSETSNTSVYIIKFSEIIDSMIHLVKQNLFGEKFLILYIILIKN